MQYGMRTRKLLVRLTAAAGLAALTTANASTFLTDGASHTWDTATPGSIVVTPGPSSPTNIDVVAGADIGEDLGIDTSLQLLGDATANIYGGILRQDLDANSTSVANVYGGDLQDDIYLYDGSTVNLDGGAVADDVYVYDAATFNFYSGSIGGILEANGESTTTITGGTVGGDVIGFDIATIQISNASITGDLAAINDSTITLISGLLSPTSSLYTTEESSLEVYGYDFLVNGAPVDFDADGIDHDGYRILLVGAGAGTLSGYLSDGTAFDTTFFRDSSPDGSGHLVLFNVPEPTSIMLMASGAMLVLLRRRA